MNLALYGLALQRTAQVVVTGSRLDEVWLSTDKALVVVPSTLPRNPSHEACNPFQTTVLSRLGCYFPRKETSRFDKSDSVADCGLDHHCIAGREMASPMMRRLQPIQKLPFKNMEQVPGLVECATRNLSGRFSGVKSGVRL